MTRAFGKIVVIALGGSIVYPEEIDWRFVKRFQAFIRGEIKRMRRKFVIAVGGGKICRMYQEAAGRIARVCDEDRDWIGIHATRTNAHLIRAVFRDIADPVVIDERERLSSLRYPVTVAGGWRPGYSTDYVAVALAEDFLVLEVVIAGKPDYVYTRDPRTHKSAQPLDALTWREYRRMIPSRWTPGASAPVDPVAARAAERARIAAVVLDGRDIPNFSRLLAGKEFKGTIISNAPL